MRRLTAKAVLASTVLILACLATSPASADGNGGGSTAYNSNGGTVKLQATSGGSSPRPVQGPAPSSGGGGSSSRTSGSKSSGSSGGAPAVYVPPPPSVVAAQGVGCTGAFGLAGCPAAPADPPVAVPAAALAAPAAPRVVDPGVLAAKALGELQLGLAQPMTAPATPNHTVVGVEVWMWVPKAQWRTLTKSVKAGPTTVAVRAEPGRVEWKPGERPGIVGGVTTPTVENCYGESGATRAWKRGMTDAAQTPCGHTYRTLSAGEPGGVFHLSAQLMYRVSWTCTGQCTVGGGDLGEVAGPAAETVLESVQRQTVNVR